jgi:hypothetical protein
VPRTQLVVRPSPIEVWGLGFYRNKLPGAAYLHEQFQETFGRLPIFSNGAFRRLSVCMNSIGKPLGGRSNGADSLSDGCPPE